MLLSQSLADIDLFMHACSIPWRRTLRSEALLGSTSRTTVGGDAFLTAFFFIASCSVGGSIDGPINGPPPGPWEIHCNPTQTFHNEVHFLEVPRTSSVTVGVLSRDCLISVG
jgi:hypothetical protein